MTGDSAPDSPIEAYLDALFRHGRDDDPRQVRYLLAEAEAHLRDSAAAARASGLSPLDAEADAVARFGSPAEVCSLDRDRFRPSYRQLLSQGAWSVVVLGGIGASAVGLSGVVAAMLRWAGGDRLVASAAPGQVLSASDCARWLAADPLTNSCRSAALADWAAETVYYRIGLGVLGLIALAVFATVRRRHSAARGALLLPALTVETTGFVLFLLAAVGTMAAGVDALLVAGGDGSGQWFSAAPVALGAALGFGWRVLRHLRSPVARSHPPAVMA